MGQQQEGTMSQGTARKLILRVGRRSRRTFNRLMVGSSLVGDPPVFPGSTFPWVARLEASLPIIQAELAAVMEQADSLPGIEEISPDHSRIARDRRWRSFFLHAYGYRSGPACILCPRTAGLVDAIPNLETAFFSVLRPGAHLPRHRGVTKALITCHLPLVVPAEAAGCWIEVEGRRHHWQVGRALLFDDTRLHEVRNDTPDSRVVLLIHVRRPLRFPGSLAGNAFMAAVKRSPFVRDGVRNQKDWEARFLAPRLAGRSFARPVVPAMEVGDGQPRGHAGEGVVVHDPVREALLQEATDGGDQARATRANHDVDG
jgi:beta-hydroxylase